MGSIRSLAKHLELVTLGTVMALLAPNAIAAAQTLTHTAGGSLEIGLSVPELTPSNLRLLRGMNDRSILQHMRVIDSLGSAIAQLAESRAQNAGVRRYAGQLVADHLRSLMVGDSIVRTSNVVFDQPRRDSAGPLVRIDIDQATGDTISMSLFHTLDSLRALPAGRRFDRTFVATEIQMHQHALAEFRELQHVARKGPVLAHLSAEIPVIQQHLIAAQELASTLGP